MILNLPDDHQTSRSFKNFFTSSKINQSLLLVDQNLGKEELLEIFNHDHSANKFKCEEELHLLDASLNRKENGSVSRSVCRKSSSASKYTHLLSYAPFDYNRKVVKCRATRARKICSVDTINKKFELIRNMLIVMGYRQGFLKKKFVCNKQENSNIKG
ncbi:unnamed protein product [Schistosoma spindalis]|nr:unnamed protein product [Schistosoma spindale]